jgi:predicted PurR-regulated permease PerM
MIMNNIFPNMENPWVRRPIVVLIVVCAFPFLLGLLVAEVIWETIKAMVQIIKKQINESKPTIAGIVDQIKDTW